MKHFLLISCILAVLPLEAQNSGLKLKLIRGGDRTVLNESHNLVGVTEPGAVVKVNGQTVKVYKTGTFVYSQSLEYGENAFKVEASKGNQTAQDGYVITRSDFVPTAPPVLVEVPKDTTGFVETTEGAYLNYGVGEDRLGGAKINYLCAGLPLQVVSAQGDLYKVQLSERRWAYVPKEYVSPRPSIHNLPSVLSESWNISNHGKTDRVIVGLEAPRVYTVRYEPDPSRLVIDFYGVVCNSNWITQSLDTKMVKMVDFQAIDSDVLRVYVYLNTQYLWGYTCNYEKNAFVLELRHTPSLKLSEMVIGLDAGHGGPSSSGAMSPSGLVEKELNLDMVYTLKSILEKKGAKVILSRTSDQEMTMAERKRIFADANVDLMLSIHCNAAGGNPIRVEGSSAYYKSIANRAFAQSVLESVLELGVKHAGLVGNFNFSLGQPSEYPCALLETLYMSNPEDEERLADASFRRSIMEKAAKGIENYIKKCRKE